MIVFFFITNTLILVLGKFLFLKIKCLNVLDSSKVHLHHSSNLHPFLTHIYSSFSSNKTPPPPTVTIHAQYPWTHLFFISIPRNLHPLFHIPPQKIKYSKNYLHKYFNLVFLRGYAYFNYFLLKDIDTLIVIYGIAITITMK